MKFTRVVGAFTGAGANKDAFLRPRIGSERGVGEKGICSVCGAAYTADLSLGRSGK